MSALDDIAGAIGKEVGLELVRQAAKLLGREFTDILSRGTDYNDTKCAAEVRAILVESRSAEAARKLGGP